MPRLGTKISGYRPATSLISIDNKVYNFLEYVSLHLGFESLVGVNGSVPDLSDNSHNVVLVGAASVSTDDYPGILSRGSLNFDAAGVDSDNYMNVSGNPKFAVNRDFSISFWLKLSNVTTTNQTIVKSDDDFLIVYLSSNKQLGFRWYEKDNPSAYFEYYVRMPATTTNDEWVHVVFTYTGGDQVGELNPDLTILGLETAKFYFNGSSSTGPTATNINSWTGNGIAVNYSDIEFRVSAPSLGDNPQRSFGSIEWWSKALTAEEANVIYQAQIVEGSSVPFNLSGFISRSPRLLLRELDDLPGSYSTVRRTGDPTRTGALTSNFNDETTIVFSESGPAVFPAMLPKGSSFASQAVDIVGQESDISASLPIRSFQQPTHLHYSPTENVGPFDESRAMPATDFYLSGTDPDVLPGFMSPLRSKAVVEIDITPTSDFKLTRNYACRNSGADRSGFAYFSFADKVWQDVGLQDPLDGSSLSHDIVFNDLISGFEIRSGTQDFMSQFTGQVNYTTFVVGSATGSYNLFDAGVALPDEVDTLRKLASLACSPTIISGAPLSTRYFATSSQVIRLSETENRINSPILLEAISMNLNVEAQCYFTASAAVGGLASYQMYPNNYVFFLYSQKKGYRSNSLSYAEISGSSRSLIASASVCFVHSASELPRHGPALTLVLTSSDPLYPTVNPVIVQYTGSLNFTFKPGTCGQIWSTANMIAATGSSPSLVTRIFQHYWPGGSSARLINGLEWQALKKSFSTPPLLTLFGISGSNSSNAEVLLNSHHFRSVGGESVAPEFLNLDILNFSDPLATNTNTRVESPYIIMPDEEIILGVEQIPTYATFSNEELNIALFPSSSMTIKALDSKIKLHYSQIQDGKEKLHILNQDLSSNSIHEVIGSEPVLDQFQIEPRSSYYGSYTDEIVTGSMAILNSDGTFTTYDQDNSRRVISRRST